MGYDAEDVKARVNVLQAIQEEGVQLTRKGRTWWGCCPFHAENTPSFQVDPDKGLWHCFGCDKGGDVIAFIMQAKQVPFAGALAYLGEKYGVRQRDTAPAASSPRRRSARPSFDGPPASTSGAKVGQIVHARVTEPDPDQLAKMERAYRWYNEGAVPLVETPAETYLRRRGIPPMFPTLCGVKYAAAWYGKGDAVLFPILAPVSETGDEARLVAVQGRFLDQTIDPQKQTAGPSSLGAFLTPEALHQPYAVICEAPIDALSLAICGVPALAVIGTNCPAWLPGRLQGKQVYAAFDRDRAGEGGARKLCAAMGTAIYRLRPDGVKDWNDLLLHLGMEGLTRKLAGIMQESAIP